MPRIQEQLALLATPVVGQRAEIEFERNNFFIVARVNAGDKQEVSTPDEFKHGERLSQRTLPSVLLTQIIHSCGVAASREEFFNYFQARAKQYKEELDVYGTDIEELVAEILPRNALINQAFEASYDFLHDHYDTLYDHILARAHQFGQYAVVQAALVEAGEITADRQC